MRRAAGCGVTQRRGRERPVVKHRLDLPTFRGGTPCNLEYFSYGRSGSSGTYYARGGSTLENSHLWVEPFTGTVRVALASETATETCKEQGPVKSTTARSGFSIDADCPITTSGFLPRLAAHGWASVCKSHGWQTVDGQFWDDGADGHTYTSGSGGVTDTRTVTYTLRITFPSVFNGDTYVKTW